MKDTENELNLDFWSEILQLISNLVSSVDCKVAKGKKKGVLNALSAV